MTEHSTEHSKFVSWKYTSFASITDDLAAGNLDAAFILAPLAMVMNRRGNPVKIVHLGHRDGTTLIVPTDSTYQDFADLRGKKIAIPHQYSNQRILVERLKDQFGMGDGDITIVEFPPPEMPAALKAGQFDAFIVGEPFPSKAEMDGFGRVMYFTKDIWPNFISCVLIVTPRLIESDPELVTELVQGISASGKWLDKGDERLVAGLRKESDGPAAPGEDVLVVPDGFGQTPRMQASLIAGLKYNLDPEILKWALSKPPDRVKYTDLELAAADFEEIQRYAERLGFFDFRPVTPEDPFGFEDYCDPTFERTGTWAIPLAEE